MSFYLIALSLSERLFFYERVFILKKKYTNKQKLQRLTTAAVLSALSLVLMATIRFPIFPSMPFYEMEFSDVPILLCSSLLGPVYSIISLFIVCLIQTLFFSSSSGFIGFVMHFVSSGLMILVVYFISKKIKGIKGALISGASGAVVMTLVMIPMNIWLTSVFMNLDLNAFVSGFLAVCVAFNLIKSSSNLLIYNLLSPKLVKEYTKLIEK